MKRRLSNAVFRDRKLRNLSFCRKIVQRQTPRVDYISVTEQIRPRMRLRLRIYIIQTWADRLLILTETGNAKAFGAG